MYSGTEPSVRCQDLGDISCTCISLFCLKLRCHDNQGRLWQSLFDYIIIQLPDAENLLLDARISVIYTYYASQARVYFVFKFRCHGSHGRP